MDAQVTCRNSWPGRIAARWLFLIVALSPVTLAAQDQTHKTTAFESAGMNLFLEELIQTEDVVWAMDFVDSDTMIFTERQGRVRLLDLRTNELREVTGAPKVLVVSSGGLFDVLVDPEFEKNGYVYFTYIKETGDGSATTVARARLRGEELIELEDLLVANNASPEPAHWGSRIAMDSQRYLFVTVGDRHVPDNAQNLKSHGGKVLRLTDDGGIPTDNPFVERQDAAPEIWSYGHRNPQGLVIHPITGQLFEQEHGPTGGDEINIIERGRNYGWPVITYGENIWGGQKAEGTEKAGMEQPLAYYQPGIAPTGLTFYFGDRLPAWDGNLFTVTLRAYMNRLVLDGDRVVDEEKRMLVEWRERLRDIVQGPDDLLYLATESGKIARLTPIE